jgi:hypothetical protein
LHATIILVLPFLYMYITVILAVMLKSAISMPKNSMCHIAPK